MSAAPTGTWNYEVIVAPTLSWSGHVSDYVGLANAMAKGQSTVDHLDNFLGSTLPAATQKKYEAGMPPIVLADEAHPSRFGEIARSVASAGTAIIPTMVIFDTLYSGREPEEIRLERVECRYLPKPIVDAWVGTFRQYAAGQAGDSGPRIAAHRRAALTALHEAGARVGARADFTLVRGNPLIDAGALFDVEAVAPAASAQFTVGGAGGPSP